MHEGIAKAALDDIPPGGIFLQVWNTIAAEKKREAEKSSTT